jgi:hypothetical protein
MSSLSDGRDSLSGREEYDGDLNELGEKHGRGVLILENGDRYIGDFVDDNMVKFIIFIFSMEKANSSGKIQVMNILVIFSKTRCMVKVGLIGKMENGILDPM